MNPITPKAAREAKGYSVPHVAQKAGVAPHTLYSLERGENATLSSLAKVAAALEVSPAALFEGWRLTSAGGEK